MNEQEKKLAHRLLDSMSEKETSLDAISDCLVLYDRLITTVMKRLDLEYVYGGSNRG